MIFLKRKENKFLMQNICFFCSSSNSIKSDYLNAAKEIASIFAKNKFNLIFGAVNAGLMKEVVNVFFENKCHITGIVPEKIYRKIEVFNKIDEFIITKSLSERIEKMIEKSDAFLILPGGFGTLHELMTVITLKQIEEIDKPIVIYNYKNFYSFLIKQIKLIFDKKFIKIYKEIYFISENIEEIYNYILDYKSFSLVKETKWC